MCCTTGVDKARLCSPILYRVLGEIGYCFVPKTGQGNQVEETFMAATLHYKCTGMEKKFKKISRWATEPKTFWCILR